MIILKSQFQIQVQFLLFPNDRAAYQGQDHAIFFCTRRWNSKVYDAQCFRCLPNDVVFACAKPQARLETRSRTADPGQKYVTHLSLGC